MFQLRSFVTGAALAASALGFAYSASALEVGETAPCVVLDQVQADGSNTEGCIRDVINENHRYTLIEFFSTTCSACAENLPKVSALSEDVQGTTTVRLVSIDRNEANVRTYVNQHRDLINFPVAFDVNRDAKRAYDITQTPTLFVLDRQNVVHYKHTGVLSDADLVHLRQLLSQ